MITILENLNKATSILQKSNTIEKKPLPKMGNVPAKITGKYQSYDINTPDQHTPAMPQARRHADLSPSKPNNNNNQSFVNENNESDTFYKEKRATTNVSPNERSMNDDNEDIVKRNLESKSVCSHASDEILKSEENNSNIIFSIFKFTFRYGQPLVWVQCAIQWFLRTYVGTESGPEPDRTGVPKNRTIPGSVRTRCKFAITTVLFI